VSEPLTVEPATIADPPWTRLNIRMLLVNVVGDVIRAAPALLALLLAGGRSGQGAVWSSVAAGIAVLAGTTRWATTRYRITGPQVQLRTGLLRRRRMTVPLDRVRTVDVQATLMHRFVGLTRVRLGTGRSDNEKERHLTLDGLSPEQAARLRADVLHRHPAGAESAEAEPPAASPAVPAQEVELARLDPAWIRYGPFTLTGFLTLLAVAGLAWRVINEAHVNPDRYAAVRGVRNHVHDTSPVVLAVQATLSLVVLVAILSTAGYVLAFWGFRLTRTAEGTVHVSRGLLTTRATTIESRRLRGVELSEPLLLRLVRGARVIAVATGLRVGRGAERGGEILLPPAPKAVAVAVAAAVCRTDQPGVASLRPHPEAAQRRRFTRAGLAVVGVAAVAVALAVQDAPAAVPLLLGLTAVALVPVAFDRYRSLGHALVAGFFVVREGTIVRRRVALETEAIIGWNLRSSWFQRRAGVTTLVATTACGRQKYRALDLSAAEAVPFAETATPGLLTPFLETSDTAAG
jgi:putative membrane protein